MNHVMDTIQSGLRKSESIREIVSLFKNGGLVED